MGAQCQLKFEKLQASHAEKLAEHAFNHSRLSYMFANVSKTSPASKQNFSRSVCTPIFLFLSYSKTNCCCQCFSHQAVCKLQRLPLENSLQDLEAELHE
jgi:hypothetical protein